MSYLMRAAVLALSTVALTAGGFTAGTAQADPGSEQFCAVNIDRGTTNCYSSFTDVIRVATGGTVTDAPRTAAEAARNPALLRRLGFGDKSISFTLAPSYLLGLEFDGKDYTGAALAVYGFTKCTTTTSDVDRQLAKMPAGWNDRISSSMNFNNCYTMHITGENFSGFKSEFCYCDDMTEMPVLYTELGTIDLDNATGSIEYS